VGSGGGADLMLQFRLEWGGDETKYCQKMKRRQQDRLNFMGRKYDTVRRHCDVGRRRCDTGEEKGRRRHELN
jgi:hypothetical protein